MTQRHTSIEAYEKIRESGVLSRSRLAVLWYVAHHPECTAFDCEEHYNPRNRSTINARFSELILMGLVRECVDLVGDPLYKVQNGHKRITYECTGVTDPTPLPKKLMDGDKVGLMMVALTNVRASTTLREAQYYADKALTQIAQSVRRYAD